MNDKSFGVLKTEIGNKHSAKVSPTVTNPTIKPDTSEVSCMSVRDYMYKTQMRLVRVRISNMDASKANLRGEFVTVANDYLGNVTKFIPFGEGTEAGYHIPFCIYQALKDKKFLQTRNVRSASGRERIETSWVSEYAIEILPPLSSEELADLAKRQAIANASEEKDTF